MQLEPGQRLGPYEIVGPLGAGTMGLVYRARDTRLGREVAVKLLQPIEGGRGATRAERLEREARTVAALDHPNLLTLFDVGRHEGGLYLVTELLSGESLRQRLERDGRIEAETVARIGLELARGLAAAHARGVVHRDLKPENVFLTTDGRTKILDFGLASGGDLEPGVPLGEAATVDATADGAIVGTAPYVSPEQARGEPVDGRSDLFALGTLLHECLTGTSPFRRDGFAATLTAVLHDSVPAAPVPPAAVELGRLVERCLAKRPELRPASAGELAAALERAGRAIRDGDGAGGRAVAVLPFADMSAARDQAYLCEGIAEEILFALNGVEGLRVASRTSSFQFGGGGHDAREIGTRLGVDSILEGSVRRAGDRLRVTVQLIEAATGYLRWTARYDRGVEDLFAIQDEIAASVAGCLSPTPDDGALERSRHRGTRNVEAYEAYLRGRQLAQHHRARSFRRAIEEYERALALDPEFAAAWAGLADANGQLHLWYGHDASHLVAAERASARAVELDPEGPDVLVAHGHVLMLQGREAESERAFEEALRRDPHHTLALYLFARVRFTQGRMEESAALFERGAAADPDDYQCVALAIGAYESLGQTEKQLDSCRRTLQRVRRRLEIAPADGRAVYLGALALEQLGERDEAMAWLERALEIDPDESPTLYNVACGFARLGRADEALDLLERIVDIGFGHRAWVERDTDFASVREMPRFRELLERMR